MAAKVRQLAEMSRGWAHLYDTNKQFAMRLGRQNFNRGLEIFPGLKSDDLSMLKFKSELHEKLQDKQWQSNPADTQSSRITGSWDSLLSIAGYLMSPVSVGMESNEWLIKEKKLPTKFHNDNDRLIMVELARAMFGTAKLTSMSFKKSSSSGFPLFVSDLDVKERLWQHGCSVLLANLGKKLTPRQFIDLQMPCCYITGARAQPEGLKPRTVFDGYDFVQSDKMTPFEGFHTMRHRLVYAGSGAANYAINTVFTCIRANYYSEFEKTFKVRFADDISDRFSRFASKLTVDVSNYDTTIQEWMFDALLIILEEEEILDPVFVSLLRAKLGGPSASPSPYPLELNKRWKLVGDPYENESYAMTKGLMSGIAVVSDFGRFFMTWNLLCMLHRVTGDVIGNVDRYLKHQMPLAAFTNSSDDNFIGAVSDDLMKKWIGTKDHPVPHYFDVQPEDFLIYLGPQYFETDGGLGHVPNLNSWLVKWQCPEHPIANGPAAASAIHRRYWQDGWFGRNGLYDYHPQYRDLYELTDSIFKKHHDISLRGIIESGTQAAQSMALSEVDKIYLDNPDSIHYKIDIKDVSPHLLKADFGQISVDRVEKVLTKLVGRNMQVIK